MNERKGTGLLLGLALLGALVIFVILGSTLENKGDSGALKEGPGTIFAGLYCHLFGLICILSYFFQKSVFYLNSISG